MVTRPAYAANFYPGDVRAQMESFRKGFTASSVPDPVLAGIVPHAGWFFSGATAAKVFLSIHARQTPETFIIFGAVHNPGVRNNSIYSYGDWQTPLGQVQVDEPMAASLVDEMRDIAVSNLHAHAHEHSIEVQLPMVKYLFPEAKVVPIAVPPGESAAELGGRVGRFIREHNKKTVVIGTTDLTHYGVSYGFSPMGYGRDAHGWMKQNDSRIIDLAINLRYSEIIPEARENHNACGAGAMAATVAAAKALDADKGVLLEHTTSYDVYPEGDFQMAVGYAGIIF